MSPGRIAVGRARAVRAFLALTALSACLATVAYAATRSGQVGLGGSKPVEAGTQEAPGPDRSPGTKEESLLQPRFLEYPERVSTTPEPQFRFHVPPRVQPTAARNPRSSRSSRSGPAVFSAASTAAAGRSAARPTASPASPSAATPSRSAPSTGPAEPVLRSPIPGSRRSRLPWRHRCGSKRRWTRPRTSIRSPSR